MSKQPKLMNFSRMRSIIEPQAEHIGRQFFMNNEMAVLRGGSSLFSIIIRQEPPFSIDDHRLGIILSGEVRLSLNLVEKTFSKGMLVFVGPGSIISPIAISDDISVLGVGLSNEFPMPFALGQMPSAFNGQVRDFQVPASEHDLETAHRILDTIWHVVREKDYNRQTVRSLVAALLQHYDGLYQQFTNSAVQNRSREQTLLEAFLRLVNQHSAAQHALGFYAEKMCLTERYLGTVVRKASGVTAKEWIDRALLERVKVLLRHSDMPVNQIADQMNFANPSFFNKFFKRLTGVSPLQFRQHA